MNTPDCFLRSVASFDTRKRLTDSSVKGSEWHEIAAVLNVCPCWKTKWWHKHMTGEKQEAEGVHVQPSSSEARRRSALLNLGQFRWDALVLRCSIPVNAAAVRIIGLTLKRRQHRFIFLNSLFGSWKCVTSVEKHFRGRRSGWAVWSHRCAL